MKFVEKRRGDELGGDYHVFEAYPKVKRKKTDLEQHYVVPWEMTMEKKKMKKNKAKRTIISSEQVAYF